jgi:peptidyl-prolyl cis-trans isomerase D
MLQDIRDRSKGPVAWFIIALICVPFALWGINSYFEGGGGSNDVAKVGGQTISDTQLQRAYNNRFRQLQQMMGKQFDPDTIKPQVLRKQVLHSMIQRSLLIQYANEQGYRVTDGEVLAYLQQMPVFQENGKFSPQKYHQLLQQNGMQAQAFEDQIRQALLVQQLQKGLQGATLVTQTDVKQAWRFQHERRAVSFLVFHAGHYQKQAQVSQDQIEKYYRSHKQAFSAPKQVKLAYIALDSKHLKPDQAASESNLKQLYKNEKNQFTTPGERRVRHILIKVGKGESGKKAKAKAEKIRNKIENGANFKQMAEKYSQDAGSNSSGGQLGWIKRDSSMPKPFIQAAFDTQQGAVSQPVRTQYGWHLIKVETVHTAHVASFDDPKVQAKLKRQYRRQAGKARFEKMSDKLNRLAFENPDSLKPAAKKLGLKIKTTGWITRNGDHSGILSHSKVRNAAFSGQVYKQHVNSKPIDLSSGEKVVLRVADEKPERTKPLDEVKDRIRQTLQQQQGREKAAAAAEKALAAAQRGEGLKGLSSDYGDATYGDPGLVGRDQKEMNKAMLKKAFDLPPPAKGKTAYAAVALNNGDSAVVALHGRKFGDPSKASDSDLKVLKQQLVQRQAQAEFSLYMHHIRNKIKVKIFKDNLRSGGSNA